jgi:hypothetical protein
MCCTGCLMAVVSGPLHPSWCLCRLTGLSSATIATSAAMCSPSGTSCLACESATHGPAAERQQLCHISWRSAGGTCCATPLGCGSACVQSVCRLAGCWVKCRDAKATPYSQWHDCRTFVRLLSTTRCCQVDNAPHVAGSGCQRACGADGR